MPGRIIKTGQPVRNKDLTKQGQELLEQIVAMGTPVIQCDLMYKVTVKIGSKTRQLICPENCLEGIIDDSDEKYQTPPGPDTTQIRIRDKLKNSRLKEPQCDNDCIYGVIQIIKALQVNPEVFPDVPKAALRATDEAKKFAYNLLEANNLRPKLYKVRPNSLRDYVAYLIKRNKTWSALVPYSESDTKYWFEMFKNQDPHPVGLEKDVVEHYLKDDIKVYGVKRVPCIIEERSLEGMPNPQAQWTCAVCTFLNNPAIVCEMCGAPNPHRPQSRRLASSDILDRHSEVKHPSESLRCGVPKHKSRLAGKRRRLAKRPILQLQQLILEQERL